MQQKGLNSLRATEYFSGDVKIIKKSKPGPVVFIVTNGIGAVEAVIKDSEFNNGDIVHIKGYMNELMMFFRTNVIRNDANWMVIQDIPWVESY